MKLTIGTLTFPSKKAATEHFSAMLARYALGERVCAEDEIDLLALLARHPEADEKIGCGVAHFAVHQNFEWGSASFWIIREDGSKIDFSYRTCIAGRGKPDGAPESLREAYAMRDAKREFLED